MSARMRTAAKANALSGVTRRDVVLTYSILDDRLCFDENDPLNERKNNRAASVLR